MAINEKYFHKNFTQQDLSKESAKDFEGDIVGSCFAQTEPNTVVFPPAMQKAKFFRCNLDNCVIPLGNTVDSECTHKQFRRQNDMEYWLVNGLGAPTEPLNKAEFLKWKLSIDPADIPAIAIERSVLSQKESDVLEEAQAAADAEFEKKIADNQQRSVSP